MSIIYSVDHIFSFDELETLFSEQIADSRAVGRDGIRMTQFKENLNSELTLISCNAITSSYKFTGYKQKLISKGASKPPREISIPTIRDRVTLRAICNYLHVEFSERLQQPPHAYIKKISKRLAHLSEDHCFLRIDIKDFYPSIEHAELISILKQKISDDRILKLIKASITCPTGHKNDGNTINFRGIPQGLSISNILSSIYMAKIDEHFVDQENYFRFVDDILFIIERTNAEKEFNSIRKALEQIGLTPHSLGSGSSSKSNISTIEGGVEYLGYRIAKNDISIRDLSYKRMFKNLSRVFTDYKYGKDKKKFLWRLNLKITGCVVSKKRFGWVIFFSQSTNKSQFARLDAFVQENLEKYKIDLNVGNVKKFVKAYHEIKYNFDKTAYIPNFERYSIDDMIRTICILKDCDFNDVASWEEADIKQLFWKYIKKETANLEKDLFEAFS